MAPKTGGSRILADEQGTVAGCRTGIVVRRRSRAGRGAVQAVASFASPHTARVEGVDVTGKKEGECCRPSKK
ncbi:MAG: hypothetical protein HKM86_04710 [Deltaproteobacteria bacterium]|nr:hypothetical protein [Deltaproteobacteria bacterium]